jgi:predicted nucleic acid-binding protein
MNKVRGTCSAPKGTAFLRAARFAIKRWMRHIRHRPLLVCLVTHTRCPDAELPYLAGNQLRDAHTAILMREHGIRQICTRDTNFHQFAFLEVIDPLRS